MSGYRVGTQWGASWLHRIMVAGAVLLMLVPAAPAMAKDKEPTRSGEDFEWRGPVAAGKMIEIKGINGSISAEATSGTEVQVEAHKSGHRSDPDEVKIEVIQHADGVTICAVYPTPPGERPNECAPGDGGHMNTKNNDVNVEFTVRVPNGVRFTGRTVNGSIKARGLRADAEARTVNGSVDITTRGIASASTVNGSIDAEMGTNPKEALEFETVNGGITLVLPASAGAEIRASTVNGSIESDLPITSIGKISHRKLQGTIGKGGPRLKMSTVNGDIRLRTSS